MMGKIVLLQVFWVGTDHGEVELNFKAGIFRVIVQIHCY